MSLTFAGRSLDRKLQELRRRCRVSAVSGNVTFQDGPAEAAYIAASAVADSRIPEIVELAGIVRGLPPHKIAEELWAFVRRNVRYQLDIDGEQFDDALTTLLVGEDDCDGQPRTLVALAIAAGIEGATRAIMPPDRMSVDHYQGLLRWPGSRAHYRAMNDGWVLAEVTLACIRLGDGAEMGEGPEDELHTVGN